MLVTLWLGSQSIAPGAPAKYVISVRHGQPAGTPSTSSLHQQLWNMTYMSAALFVPIYGINLHHIWGKPAMSNRTCAQIVNWETTSIWCLGFASYLLLIIRDYFNAVTREIYMIHWLWKMRQQIMPRYDSFAKNFDLHVLLHLLTYIYIPEIPITDIWTLNSIYLFG